MEPGVDGSVAGELVLVEEVVLVLARLVGLRVGSIGTMPIVFWAGNAQKRRTDA